MSTDVIEAPSVETEQPAAPQAPSHLSLVERAIDRGASVDVIERMMDLADRQMAKEAKQAFDRAMAAALADMPSITKTASADRYRYETLQSVVDAVRDPLSRHGLSFRWRTDQSGNMVRVTCVVSHEDGHAEETSLQAPPEGPRGTNAVQALGATVTYLQRYTLKAALGVAAGEDTDGRVPTPASQSAPDTSDLLARIWNARTVGEIDAMRDEIAALPRESPARRGAIDAATKARKQLMEAADADA